MLEFLPFVIAFVIMFTLILIINRKTSNPSYDERQIIARNNAYKSAFAALLFYFVASELVTMLRNGDWCTPECNIGIGLFVCVSVFAVTSIMKDAYAPVTARSQNGRNLLVIVLLGIFQLYLGISDIIEFGFMQDGLLNLPVTFCVGVLMIVVVLAQLIKFAFDRKAAKDED